MNRFRLSLGALCLAAGAMAQEAATPPDSAAAEGLEKVVVSASRKPEKSEYVAKMPLKRLENPQVYNTIEARTLKEQVVTNFDAALKNAPGVTKLWEPTGRGGDGGTYFTMRGFETQPNMINGIPGLTFGGLDPANLERIEVLKGPSATLFGSGVVYYGGIINVVTKKPRPEAFTEATYVAGSFGLNRVVTDVNRPLDADGKAAARVITAYHTENSFQDAGFRKSLFVAPSLSYQPNDRLSFLVSTEFLSTEGTNPVMLFPNRSKPLDWTSLKQLDYDTRLSLTSNELSVRNPKLNVQAQMEYKLDRSWTSQTILARGVSESHGYYSYLWNELPGSFSLWIHDENTSTQTTNLQQNFLGDYQVLGLRNRTVIGFDYFQRNAVDNGSGWGQVTEFTPQGEEIPIVYGTDTMPTYSLTRASVNQLLAGTGRSNSNVKEATYGAYVSDVINLTPKLAALLSVRADWFTTEGEFLTPGDGYDQFAVSPKVGLVYQPVLDRVSLFANYMNGFQNVAPAHVSDTDFANPRIKTFRPEQANQVEGGMKTNLFGGRVSSTASVYYIRVSDRVMGDPTNPNNSLQGGETESRGFELDANIDVLPGLNVLLGYSYNQSEVLSFNGDDVFLPVGRRPVDAGPPHLFNAWATYRLQQGALRGLGFGAGANAASAMAIMDSPTIGTFKLPAYMIFNASVFYNAGPFGAALAVDNLTDVEYYTGYSTINPQKPRNVSASLSYDF